MKRLSMVMVLVLCVPLLSNVSHAGYAEGTPFSAGNTNTTPAPDAYGQIVRIVGGSKCKATAAPPSYSEGDEVPQVGTSYVKNTGAANEVALFDLTDSSTAGISGTIHAVRPLIQARLDAAGTSAFSMRTRSGTTNTDLATVALTTGGAYISTTYATDPNIAGAWSTSAIDALEVGGIETAAVSTRLQDVHVYVEYTEAVASSSGSLMMMGVGSR